MNQESQPDTSSSAQQQSYPPHITKLLSQQSFGQLTHRERQTLVDYFSSLPPDAANSASRDMVLSSYFNDVGSGQDDTGQMHGSSNDGGDSPSDSTQLGTAIPQKLFSYGGDSEVSSNPYESVGIESLAEMTLNLGDISRPTAPISGDGDGMQGKGHDATQTAQAAPHHRYNDLTHFGFIPNNNSMTFGYGSTHSTNKDEQHHHHHHQQRPPSSTASVSASIKSQHHPPPYEGSTATLSVNTTVTAPSKATPPILAAPSATATSTTATGATHEHSKGGDIFSNYPFTNPPPVPDTFNQQHLEVYPRAVSSKGNFGPVPIPPAYQQGRVPEHGSGTTSRQQVPPDASEQKMHHSEEYPHILQASAMYLANDDRYKQGPGARGGVSTQYHMGGYHDDGDDDGEDGPSDSHDIDEDDEEEDDLDNRHHGVRLHYFPLFDPVKLDILTPGNEHLDLLLFIRLAKEARRFKDMASLTRQLAVLVRGRLSPAEQDLFFYAHKQVLLPMRQAFRIYATQPSKVMMGPTLSNPSLPMPPGDGQPSQQHLNNLQQRHERMLNGYASQLSYEIRVFSKSLADFVLCHILREENTAPEHVVSFLKFIGDLYRYIAEAYIGTKDNDACRLCRSYYHDAALLAERYMAITSPIRLGLLLNYSVAAFELFNDHVSACEMAKCAYLRAITRLNELTQEEYNRSTLILQLMRDNIDLWLSLLGVTGMVPFDHLVGLPSPSNSPVAAYQFKTPMERQMIFTQPSVLPVELPVNNADSYLIPRRRRAAGHPR